MCSPFHRVDGESKPMRVRSMVGLIPLYACLVLENEVIHKLPGFRKRLQWFLKNRQDLANQVNNYNAFPICWIVGVCVYTHRLLILIH